MRNRKRKVNKAKGPQGPGSLNLAGFVFLVVENDPPKLVARGKIAFTQGGAYHMIQFGGGMFRMMSNESLQQGLLYPDDKRADEFLDSFLSPQPGLLDDDDEAFDREAPPQLEE